jgi:hypothetical protein
MSVRGQSATTPESVNEFRYRLEFGGRNDRDILLP